MHKSLEDLIAPQLCRTSPARWHGTPPDSSSCCTAACACCACPGVAVQSQSATSDVTADHFDVCEGLEHVLYASARVTACSLAVPTPGERLATGTAMKHPL